MCARSAAPSTSTTTLATGPINDPGAVKSLTTGCRPGGEARGGAGAFTTSSSIRANPNSRNRSKSFICRGNASCKRSTHPQPRSGVWCYLSRGAWGLTIVELVSQLDQLQAEGSRAEEPGRQHSTRPDDWPGVDDIVGQPRYPRPHLIYETPRALRVLEAVTNRWCRTGNGKRAPGC